MKETRDFVLSIIIFLCLLDKTGGPFNSHDLNSDRLYTIG